MQIIYLHGALAALVSALVFLLTLKGFFLGVLVLFVPMIPLFYAALRHGSFGLNVACGGAVLVCLFGGGLAAGLQFALLHALPCWVFGRQLLKLRLLPSGGVEWFPIGGAFVAYSLFGFLSMGVLSGYLVSNTGKGLLELLRQDISATASQMDPAVAATLTNVVEHYPFVIMPAFFWCWGLVLFGFAWLAKELCVVSGGCVRRSLALTPFLPPVWWFALVGISLVAGLSGDAELRFTGLSMFFIALLPYFMAGMAMLEREVRKWSHAGWWRAGLYGLVVLGQGPVLMMVTCYGVFLHVSHVYRTKNG